MTEAIPVPKQEAHLGNEHSLLLDIDGFKGFDNFIERLWILKYLGIKVLKAEVYRTVNGRHAVLTCDNQISPMEILLFECMLGDDYRRTLCNYQKLTHGTKNFDFLFSWKAKTNAIGETTKVSEEKFSQEDSDKLTQAIRLGE